MPYFAMKTKLIQLSAIAALAFAGSAIAADQAPAPSSAPSSNPTDIRNPNNPSSPASPANESSGGAVTSRDTAAFEGKIVSIDKDTRVVTIQEKGGATRKLHIGETTKLSRGSASAEWDDLKVGTEIRGMQKGQRGSMHAESVTISTSEAK
jgi:hypothetical protein